MDSSELPHDLDAERYTLAAMMINPAAIEAAAEILVTEHFYRPAHQVLFNAMVQMFAAGERIDPVTLMKWLREDGDIKALGPSGAIYIAELSGLGAAPASVSHYAQAVFACAVRRKMLEQAYQLQQAAYADADPAGIIARAEVALAPLRDAMSETRRSAVMTTAAFCDQVSPLASPVIDGLLDHQDRVVLVAPEGRGKTHLLHQVAYCAGAGVHPFMWSIRYAPKRVMLIDLETPMAMLQGRLRKMAERASLEPGWNPDNVWMVHRPGGINLNDPREGFGLAQLIARVKPDLIIGGPVYKMIDTAGDDNGLQAHARVARFFDVMRERHGCAVWLEAHAPGGQSGGDREMRPEGSNIWRKWPEFGVSMIPAKKAAQGAMDFNQFRGHRDESRLWPTRLVRNISPGGWPWEAEFPPGTFKRQLVQ